MSARRSIHDGATSPTSPGKRVLRLYPVIGTTDRRVDRQTDAQLGPPSRSMNVIKSGISSTSTSTTTPTASVAGNPVR